MAHQSLYRTYRPQTFDDVVGQAHITRTLRNAVADDAVAHAYLFTGPRGTGKTTIARIFAKALECEKGPTPEPDGTCEQCVDIAEGRHPDVHELDAASRTQVDVVREEIIGRLAYMPTRGRWKVYIIDEVHMLSTHAFNALLKSIEEPPSHTVFVLCTTHPHKVPETIHSRCQRFDFRRIGMEDIVERLRHIAEREGYQVAEAALVLVARHAGGGMRDAISALEQVAAFTGGEISLDDVAGLLGEVDSGLLFEVADLVAARDVAGSFRFVARIVSGGVDIPEFVRGFIGHVRDLYVVSAVGDAAGIVDTTSADAARLTRQATEFGSDRLARVLEVLGELAGELRWSPDPRLAFEVALTRLARPQGEVTLAALAERVAALEVGMPVVEPTHALPEARSEPTAAKSPAEPAAMPTSPADEFASAVLADTADEPSPKPREATGQLDRARAKRAWPGVVSELRKRTAPRAAIFDGTEVDVDADGTTFVIEFPSDASFRVKQAAEQDTSQLLKESFAAVLGAPPPFRFQLGRGPVRASEEPRSEPDAVTEGTPVIEPQEEQVLPGSGGDEESAVTAPSSECADVERLLCDALGAEMIAEHPHGADGKD